MTLTDLQIAIENSLSGRVRIYGGSPNTGDYDEGWARLVTGDEPCGIIDIGEIVVAWDCGVVTVLPRPLDDTFGMIAG